MNNLIKKIIRRIITVILGIVLLTYSLIHITYIHRGYNILNGFYALPKNSIDVAIVGTSVTFTSFIPLDAFHDYGISAYNYCTNVQFENSIKYSIKDIERTQKPKIYLIDIFPFLYNHNGQNTEWKETQKELYIKYNLDSRRYHFDRLSLVNEILKDKNNNSSINEFLYYFFDIVRYHSNEINIDQYDNSTKDINRGYQHFRHVDKPYLINLKDIVNDNDSKTSKINERDEFYLKELVELSKISDSEFIFFCPPVYFYDEKNIRQKNYVVEYLNSNNCICLDLSTKKKEMIMMYNMDYWNETHFDALGAEKITKYLCNYIKKNYDIPDRRKDENYKFISDDYEAWKKTKEEYLFLDLTSVAADKQKGLIKDISIEVDKKITKTLEKIATKSNATKNKASRVATSSTSSNKENNTKKSRRINNINNLGPDFGENNVMSPDTKRPEDNRIYSFDRSRSGPGIKE